MVTMFNVNSEDLEVYFFDKYTSPNKSNNNKNLENYFLLCLEQARIEHIACMREIETLREHLKHHDIDSSTIDSWVNISDDITNKLLRYNKGLIGGMVEKKALIRPYRWRRKYRKNFSSEL